MASLVSRPVAAGLGLLSAARRARAFHPHGTTHRAVLEVDPGPHLLDVVAGRHPALVRLSRGVGLPEPLPDVQGLAVRLEEAGWDLLLASTGAGRLTRHVLVPRRRIEGATLSSLAPFARADGRRAVVGARVDGAGHATLLVAAPGGPWAEVGSLALGEEVPGEALRYDPFRTPPGLEPVGWLNDLRQPAYAASQRARPDTSQPGPV